MSASTDYFAEFVERALIPGFSPDTIESRALLQLRVYLAAPELEHKTIHDFTGPDYHNSVTLPQFLILLLHDCLKRLALVTATPVQYLASIVDWKRLLRYYGLHVTAMRQQARCRPDHILLLDVLVDFLQEPLGGDKATPLKLLLDDLLADHEVLERLHLEEVKVGKKDTFEQLRAAMLQNEDVQKAFRKLSTKPDAEYINEWQDRINSLSEFYLIREDTYFVQSQSSVWTTILRDGTILLNESNLSLTHPRRGPQLSRAKAFMALFHQYANYVKRFVKDAGKLLPPPPATEGPTDAEYFFEKMLFSRHNFLHLLGDPKPTNKALLNKLGKILVNPQRWVESNFCYTIKNMILQVTCRETVGFNPLEPSFKRHRFEPSNDKAKRPKKEKEEPACICVPQSVFEEATARLSSKAPSPPTSNLKKE